jgi:hypothetical protein
MQTSSPKSLSCFSLASAGLASALALILLGVSIPPLASQTYDFNNQSDGGWTHYDLGAITYIPAIPHTTYSFPTNTAGPAGNYAYRIQVPIYNDAADWYWLLYPRGGSILTSVKYGNTQDSTFGRFDIRADLVAWSTNYPDEEIGLAFDANFDLVGFNSANTYSVGWGPGQSTLGMASIISQAPGIMGQVDSGSTVLQPGRQYRFEVSSFDGSTFQATIYDLSQPNSPWQSVITQDTTLSSTGGNVGILGAVLQAIVSGVTEGADATWDNFFAYAPAFVDPGSTTVPAVMPATVTDLTPPPARQAFAPLVSVGFLNRDTGVNTSSNPNGWIKLYMDGVLVPFNQLTIDPTNVWKVHNNDQMKDYPGPQSPYPTSFGGATVSWIITNQFALNSLHTNTVVFEDDQIVGGHNVLHTNTWSWTAAYPPFAPSGSLSVRGFDARLVQSFTTSTDPAVYTNYANINAASAGPPAGITVLQDSLAAAQAVLNYQYTVSFAATNKVDLVDFDRNSELLNGISTTNFPGLCCPASASNPDYVDSFAVEVLAYLQLSAGTNDFAVTADDNVRVYTGTNLTDTSVILYTGNVNTGTFSWIVPMDGLYPIHIIMEEGVGGAYLCLYSVNPGNSTNLVNDVGGVKAFYPLACMSSTSVKGPFTLDAAANAGNAVTTASTLCQSGTGPIYNQTVTGGTLTFPIPSAPKYYRLDGPRKTKFTSVTKSGSNLVINYQAY